MANANQLPPIPQDQIGENYRWRDWFTKLDTFVNNLSPGSSTSGNYLTPADVGTMAYQNAYNVTILGGTIDGTVIGNTTPSSGKFTTLEAVTSLKTDSLTGYLYGNGSGGAVTASTTIPYTGWGKPPYGAYQSNATQTVSTINTPTRVSFDTVDYANLTTYTAGDGIHVQAAGLYNVQFSVQVTNSDTQAHDMDIWLRKGSGSGTATDVANTASVVTVPSTHGGQPGYNILAANFFVSLAANDFIEFWWSTNSTQVSLNYLPAITTPFTSPGASSVVATLTYVASL